jgi:hypothetical protein
VLKNTIYIISLHYVIQVNMDSEDDHEDYPWADFFMASSNPYYGFIKPILWLGKRC